MPPGHSGFSQLCTPSTGTQPACTLKITSPTTTVGCSLCSFCAFDSTSQTWRWPKNSFRFFHFGQHNKLHDTWHLHHRAIEGTLPTPFLTVKSQTSTEDFPGGSAGKESACNAGDLSLIPGSGRSPGEGNGNPLQYSCLENSMDRGAWWTIQFMGLQRVGYN